MQESLLDCHDAYTALASLWDGGRFPHALLIEGAVGSGRRTLAHQAIAMLLCRAKGDSASIPCQSCPSCHKMERGIHPDLVTIVPEPKKQSVGVDAIRLIREQAYIVPHEAERRVFFLPEAQHLTVAAQNALLKIIEEPPEAAYFVLTAPSRNSLLETVCSRSGILGLRELSIPRREAVLQTLCPEESTETLSLLAETYPTIGQALAARSDPAAQQLEQDAARLLEATIHCDRYELLRLFSAYEREPLQRLLDAFFAQSIAALRKERISALQCNTIVAIIEELRGRALANVGLPIACAVSASRLSQLPFS